MDILFISGSRNPHGQTARALAALGEGVRGEGGSVETVFLPVLHLERCRQCDPAGWGTCRSDGTCVIEDDFAMLVRKVVDSEAVVFATPVYYGDLSESLRAFLERLRRIGVRGEAPGVAGKRAVGVCVAGGGGGGAPRCCVQLEGILRTIGFDPVDLVPVRRQNLSFKCAILRQTGEWLARGCPD